MELVEFEAKEFGVEFRPFREGSAKTTAGEFWGLAVAGGGIRTKLILAFAAVYLIWGSTYLGIQIAVRTLPPFLMAGFRFLIAGSVLYALARPSAARPTLIHWRTAGLVGGLLLLGGNGLVCFGQQHVPSGLTALLVGSLPLWMAVLNWIFFAGPKPTLRTLLSIATGLVGLGLLLGGSLLLGSSETFVFALAVVAAPISWAFGSLRSRQGGLPLSLWLSTAMQMICGGALLTTVGLCTGEVTRVDLNSVSFDSMLALAYLIAFGSIIAFSAFVWLLQNAEPDLVATYAFVNPVVAVILGWLLAGETLSPLQMLGMGLVIGAVAVTVLKPKPKNRGLKS
jgi:drug/metabolite transporter (DMT)-like permease